MDLNTASELACSFRLLACWVALVAGQHQTMAVLIDPHLLHQVSATGVRNGGSVIRAEAASSFACLEAGCNDSILPSTFC
jgi:hypothetical protein